MLFLGAVGSFCVFTHFLQFSFLLRGLRFRSRCTVRERRCTPSTGALDAFGCSSFIFLLGSVSFATHFFSRSSFLVPPRVPALCPHPCSRLGVPFALDHFLLPLSLIFLQFGTLTGNGGSFAVIAGVVNAFSFYWWWSCVPFSPFSPVSPARPMLASPQRDVSTDPPQYTIGYAFARVHFSLFVPLPCIFSASRLPFFFPAFPHHDCYLVRSIDVSCRRLAIVQRSRTCPPILWFHFLSFFLFWPPFPFLFFLRFTLLSKLLARRARVISAPCPVFRFPLLLSPRRPSRLLCIFCSALSGRLMAVAEFRNREFYLSSRIPPLFLSAISFCWHLPSPPCPYLLSSPDTPVISIFSLCFGEPFISLGRIVFFPRKPLR